MVEELLSAIRAEQGNWKAALSTGLFMGVWLWLHFSDFLTGRSDAWSTNGLDTLRSLIGDFGIAASTIGLALIFGGLWCGLILWLVNLIQKALVRWLPIGRSPGTWNRLQRAMCPIWPTELSRLQNSMQRTREFQDLEDSDSEYAYRYFFGELLTNPMLALNAGDDLSSVASKSLGDIRVVAGLTVWLPACLFAAYGALPPDLEPLKGWGLVVSWGTFGALVMALAIHTRNTLTLLTRSAAKADHHLSLCATDALNASRTKKEVGQAQDEAR